ncbi:MAG: hypothetical protein ABIJ00_09290 [Candidatus Eisenbacteria bacterium]
MGTMNARSLGIAASLGVILALLLAGCCDETTIIREVEVEVPGECEDMGEFVEVFPPLGSMNFVAIWGSSESNIFAVGDYGRVAHFDGSNWELMDSGTMFYLYAVWGSGPNDVYAVGQNGTVIHYDGATWERIRLATDAHLYCIWGTSSDDIHIGSSSYFYHYDGNEWTQGPYLGSWYTKYDIWGSSPTNVFAVGYTGRIFHYDGNEWSDIGDQVPTNLVLRSIWGSDSTNVYVVGEDGTMLHHDGDTWTDITDPMMDNFWLYEIDGRSANDIYVSASNSGVFHYNGSAWERIADWGDLDGYQYGIWVGATNAYSAGEDGEITRYDGAEWTSVTGGPFDRLESVWAASATNAVAVGRDGLILRYDGATWERESITGHEYRDYNGIAGTAGNLFVSGDYGILLHDTGSGWEDVGNTGVTSDDLHDVWSSGDVAIAVGEGGAVVYYDGSLLSLMTSGTSKELRGVWGSSPADVFAVGYGGALLHYDGNVSKIWEETDLGMPYDLEDVWGTASNNVYACGGYGIVLHYDGATWKPVWIDAYEWLYGMGGTGEDDIYIIGYDDVYHYDGHSWSKLTQRATYQNLYDISCGPDGSTFAVGYEGTIIYKQP